MERSWRCAAHEEVPHQLEKLAGNAEKAEAIKNGGGKEMSNAARKYPLFVSEFFMKHVNSFINIVMNH